VVGENLCAMSKSRPDSQPYWVRLIVMGSVVLTTVVVPAGQDVPRVISPHDVTVTRVSYLGRLALKVELTAPVQTRLRESGATNHPALAILDTSFVDGVIEADLAGEVNEDGRPDARGFVGLAFHAEEDTSKYEAVYLRMTNGRLAKPTPDEPRIRRAIQYVAHPDFHFEVSREKFPGMYERGADIGPAMWIRLRLEVSGRRLRALINDELALTVEDLKLAGVPGRIGLWVGDGTAGYFANVSVRPQPVR
jgi:hypothetical protein